MKKMCKMKEMRKPEDVVLDVLDMREFFWAHDNDPNPDDRYGGMLFDFHGFCDSRGVWFLDIRMNCSEEYVMDLIRNDLRDLVVGEVWNHLSGDPGCGHVAYLAMYVLRHFDRFDWGYILEEAAVDHHGDIEWM